MSTCTAAAEGVTLIRGLSHELGPNGSAESIAPQSWPDAERAPAASYPLFNIIGYVKLLVRACTLCWL